jgi:ATP-binding cassette, subfamily B, multidrug efflux pump
MLAGLALVVVSNIFTVAGPWLLRLAIDALGDPGSRGADRATYAGLIVGAAMLGARPSTGCGELLNGISRRIECDLREDLFRHLLRLDAPFYGSWRPATS